MGHRGAIIMGKLRKRTHFVELIFVQDFVVGTVADLLDFPMLRFRLKCGKICLDLLVLKGEPQITDGFR